MDNLQHKPETETEKDKKISLKGTFISVMLLGLFIIISWFGVFILFMLR